MTPSEQIQVPDEKSGTRYGWATRYETEMGSDLECYVTAENVKNYPGTFIPMNELKKSLW